MKKLNWIIYGKDGWTAQRQESPSDGKIYWFFFHGKTAVWAIPGKAKESKVLDHLFACEAVYSYSLGLAKSVADAAKSFGGQP